MEITYNNQTIDFTMPPNKHIVISLSGGADSAALFYLACKHYPEKVYFPFTGLDENAPKDAEAAKPLEPRRSSSSARRTTSAVADPWLVASQSQRKGLGLPEFLRSTSTPAPRNARKATQVRPSQSMP